MRHCGENEIPNFFRRSDFCLENVIFFIENPNFFSKIRFFLSQIRIFSKTYEIRGGGGPLLYEPVSGIGVFLGNNKTKNYK